MSTSMLLIQLGNAGVVFFCGGGGVIYSSPLALMKNRGFKNRYLKKEGITDLTSLYLKKFVTLSNKLLHFL